MPLILNIETATDICSVCLSREEEVIGLSESSNRYDHAARITLLIQDCLQQARRNLSELDAVAVSRGPGSYTALRIGTAAAKGICFALGKPLIAVDTLQALALAASSREGMDAQYCPMIDARRMEVYTAQYDAHNQPVTEARAMMITADSFSDQLAAGHTLVLCGDGAPKCKPVLNGPNICYSPVVCSAPQLVPLAFHYFREKKFVDTAYFSPFYLKPPNITRPKKKL